MKVLSGSNRRVVPADSFHREEQAFFPKEFVRVTRTRDLVELRSQSNCSQMATAWQCVNRGNLLTGLAPQVGLEPTTLRLTA
jgi:hypothetical protein